MDRTVALYARVSSSRQEKEETIESQVEQLLTYAHHRGWTIPPALQFLDRAVSGEHLMRPGLDRLRDVAHVRGFQVLLCLHPDRLARNMGAHYVVLEELARAGVEVIFLNQPDLGDNPQAKLLYNVQGAFAEYERVLLQERMRRGRSYRLRRGESVPTQAPYGYRFQSAAGGQRSRWEVVAEEAVVVRQIFAWYNDGQLSLRQIARKLNAQGTSSPEGKQWTGTGVARLLRHSAYKGITYYGRQQTERQSVGQHRRIGRGILRFPRYTPRPAEEWITVSVPALVEETAWDAAQERARMNARYAQRNSRRFYLLRGLLVCGVCGRTLQGRSTHGKVRYTCNYGGARRPPGVALHSCSLSAEVVEESIWEALAELLRDPQRVRDAWDALRSEQTANAGEIGSWQRRAALLKRQRERLVDAYQTGVLTLEELTERRNPLDVELQALHRQIEGAPAGQPEQIALDTFVHRINQALTASEPETKQEVLRLLIERIVVNDGELVVEHIVPTASPRCRLSHTLRDA